MGFREEQDVADSMRGRRPFGLGTFIGRTGGFLSDKHRLPAGLAEQYQRAVSAGEVAYTVYSYATPVGWVLADGTAVVPEVKYSNATSRHQKMTREYLLKP
jgi:hypothetical protein